MTKPDLSRDYGALVSGSHPVQRETASTTMRERLKRR